MFFTLFCSFHADSQNHKLNPSKTHTALHEILSFINYDTPISKEGGLDHGAGQETIHRFDALIPSGRSDCGVSRKINDELIEESRYLKHTHPRLSASAIYRQLQNKGSISAKQISEATVCRFINQMMLQER